MLLYNIVLIALGALFAITLSITLLALHNMPYYAEELYKLGEMLQKCTCGGIEPPEEEYARILRITKDDFVKEREKGTLLIKIGEEICAVAEGLKSPFRMIRV